MLHSPVKPGKAFQAFSLRRVSYLSPSAGGSGEKAAAQRGGSEREGREMLLALGRKGDSLCSCGLPCYCTHLQPEQYSVGYVPFCTWLHFLHTSVSGMNHMAEKAFTFLHKAGKGEEKSLVVAQLTPGWQRERLEEGEGSRSPLDPSLPCLPPIPTKEKHDRHSSHGGI